MYLQIKDNYRLQLYIWERTGGWVFSVPWSENPKKWGRNSSFSCLCRIGNHQEFGEQLNTKRWHVEPSFSPPCSYRVNNDCIRIVIRDWGGPSADNCFEVFTPWCWGQERQAEIISKLNHRCDHGSWRQTTRVEGLIHTKGEQNCAVYEFAQLADINRYSTIWQLNMPVFVKQIVAQDSNSISELSFPRKRI